MLWIELWQTTHGVRGRGGGLICAGSCCGTHIYASIFLRLERSTNLALRMVFRGAGDAIQANVFRDRGTENLDKFHRFYGDSEF